MKNIDLITIIIGMIILFSTFLFINYDWHIYLILAGITTVTFGYVMLKRTEIEQKRIKE